MHREGEIKNKVT